MKQLKKIQGNIVRVKNLVEAGGMLNRSLELVTT